MTASMCLFSNAHCAPKGNSKLPGTFERVMCDFFAPAFTKAWNAPSYKTSVTSSFHSATMIVNFFFERSILLLDEMDLSGPAIKLFQVYYFRLNFQIRQF